MRFLKTLFVTCWALCSAAQAAPPVTAKSSAALQVAVVSVADDERYQPRRVEKRWPGQSTGRLITAARLGLDDAQVELQDAGLSVRLREVVADNEAALLASLQQLQNDKVVYWVLDLPDALMPQVLQAAQKAAR